VIDVKIVAIQGLEGSFHHLAAQKLLTTDIKLLPCMSFPEVFAAVDSGQAEYGVSAIENSLHGSINPVYRLLERHDLWIGGEATLHINQYLIGHAPAELSSFNNPQARVMSQAPALAQCELWLDKHLPKAERWETHDTADSVKQVVEHQNQQWLAVAGMQAAKLYGGTVIAGPINDDPHNYTRFVLLQKSRVEPAGANRTSVILKTDHSPGALHRALGVFDSAQVNLSKLHSHPIPTDKRHYAFYIDFDVAASSIAAQHILEALRTLGYSAKVLGSYATTEERV
jgi:prephenate dehydratase